MRNSLLTGRLVLGGEHGVLDRDSESAERRVPLRITNRVTGSTTDLPGTNLDSTAMMRLDNCSVCSPLTVTIQFVSTNSLTLMRNFDRHLQIQGKCISPTLAQQSSSYSLSCLSSSSGQAVSPGKPPGPCPRLIVSAVSAAARRSPPTRRPCPRGGDALQGEHLISLEMKSRLLHSNRVTFERHQSKSIFK